MRVRNFSYNGLTGKLLEGVAEFTAEFIKWSDDPGIAICSCSDGVERLIPTFAFVEKVNFPVQEKTGVILGTPCSSAKKVF